MNIKITFCLIWGQVYLFLFVCLLLGCFGVFFGGGLLITFSTMKSCCTSKEEIAHGLGLLWPVENTKTPCHTFYLNKQIYLSVKIILNLQINNQSNLVLKRPPGKISIDVLCDVPVLKDWEYINLDTVGTCLMWTPSLGYPRTQVFLLGTWS